MDCAICFPDGKIADALLKGNPCSAAEDSVQYLTHLSFSFCGLGAASVLLAALPSVGQPSFFA